MIEWLAGIGGFENAEPQPASGDASFRRYFRVVDGDRRHIVMDAPPEREDCRPFVRMATILDAMGMNVPRVLQANPEQGFLLLTDLGETSYLAVLSADAEKADRLYEDAIGALVRLQGKGAQFQSQLPPYDRKFLLAEMELFITWLCNRHLDLSLTAGDISRWRQTCIALADSALQQTRVFVHRDYHSRNLMVCDNNNPGILDFQDALEGPLTYDLVSLLKDCYIKWPAQRIHDWSMNYYEMLAGDLKSALPDDAFTRAFDLMGVQRHLKASGIFARLDDRDGKPDYLPDIPRTLEYIVNVAPRYPELDFLAELVAERCLPALGGATRR